MERRRPGGAPLVCGSPLSLIKLKLEPVVSARRQVACNGGMPKLMPGRPMLLMHSLKPFIPTWTHSMQIPQRVNIWAGHWMIWCLFWNQKVPEISGAGFKLRWGINCGGESSRNLTPKSRLQLKSRDLSKQRLKISRHWKKISKAFEKAEAVFERQQAI